MYAQHVVNGGGLARDKWGLFLVDPLLPQPVYWALDKPKVVVSLTRGQLFSVISWPCHM